MSMINRRAMIKSLGGVSLADVMPIGRPVFRSREDKDCDSGELDCDVLVVGGGTAGVIAALAFQKDLSPAEVPVEEIKSLIQKHGGIVPPHLT